MTHRSEQVMKITLHPIAQLVPHLDHLILLSTLNVGLMKESRIRIAYLEPLNARPLVPKMLLLFLEHVETASGFFYRI